jgi:hypothetical protein
MEPITVDAGKVVESLTRQLADKCKEVAQRDAIIGELSEQALVLRRQIDELAAQIPTPPEPGLNGKEVKKEKTDA